MGCELRSWASFGDEYGREKFKDQYYHESRV